MCIHEKFKRECWWDVRFDFDYWIIIIINSPGTRIKYWHLYISASFICTTSVFLQQISKWPSSDYWYTYVRMRRGRWWSDRQQTPVWATFELNQVFTLDDLFLKLTGLFLPHKTENWDIKKQEVSAETLNGCFYSGVWGPVGGCP